MTSGFQHQGASLGAFPMVKSAPKPQHVGQPVARLDLKRPAEPRSFELKGR